MIGCCCVFPSLVVSPSQNCNSIIVSGSQLFFPHLPSLMCLPRCLRLRGQQVSSDWQLPVALLPHQDRVRAGVSVLPGAVLPPWKWGSVITFSLSCSPHFCLETDNRFCLALIFNPDIRHFKHHVSPVSLIEAAERLSGKALNLRAVIPLQCYLSVGMHLCKGHFCYETIYDLSVSSSNSAPLSSSLSSVSVIVSLRVSRKFT